MSDQPWDDPEWKAYAARISEELVPMIYHSGWTMSLVPDGETDIKFAVELGLSIMMDKPILAVALPGTEIPDRLRRVADAIFVGDPRTPEGADRLAAQIAQFAAEHGEPD